MPADGVASLTAEFSPGTVINGLRIPDGGADGRIQILRLWQESPTGRRLLYAGRPSVMITFPDVTADRMTLELQVPDSRPVMLNEIQFIHNPRHTPGGQWIWRPADLTRS